MMVTLLQVSDMQFGEGHRFDRSGLTDADRRHDRLVSRLLDDLEGLRERHGLVPELVVVPGDLAEKALPAEYDAVYEFLAELADGLGLSRNRIVIVPGNHDVSWFKCQAYVLAQLGEGKQPVAPHWPKWEPYAQLVTRLYGVEFARDEPWQLIQIPERRVVVAAMNSTMAETHEVHHGYLGEEQLAWFHRELRAFEKDGWLRIGVLHHNPIRGAGDDNAHLVDVDQFVNRLAGRLNLVLHGHTHASGTQHLGPGALPVLGVGSAGVDVAARAPEVPNQYQLVRVSADEITVYGRRYDPGLRQWVGDTGIGEHGDDWRRVIAVQLSNVDMVFPDSATANEPGGSVRSTARGETRGAARGTTRRPDGRHTPLGSQVSLGPHTGTHLAGTHLAGTQLTGTHLTGTHLAGTQLPAKHLPGTHLGETHRGSDEALERLIEVCELRWPQARITKVVSSDAALEYLRVSVVRDLVVEQFPVGLCRKHTAEQDLRRFVDDVDARFRRGGPAVGSTLVYDDVLVSGAAESEQALRHYAELREYAQRHGVALVSFAEFQGGHDLRPYASRQAAVLARDEVYPPQLYVTQRYHVVGGATAACDDLLEDLADWLTWATGQFVVVLGSSGYGKTFLLRQLARKMYLEEHPAVPVLVELRALEKAHGLDELVAAQLTRGGEQVVDLPKFRYLLREGRVALLFDGFDELATRVTYDRATEHLASIAQAYEGRAKVVLTSRTEHFLTHDQITTAMADKLRHATGRRLIEITRFDETQIRQFLTNLLGGDTDAANRRLHLVRDVKDLLGLSRNPRMLSFIAQVDEDRLRAARERDGEVTAAALYRELITQWLGYEVRRGSARGAAPTLGHDERFTALTQLALRLWRSTETSLGVDDLGEAARTLVDLVAAQRRTTIDRQQATQLIGSGTLLVRDAAGRFSFVHHSVAEWLVANHVAEDWAGDDGGDVTNTGRTPHALSRPMSQLMIDFLCSLAGRETAKRWARAAASEPGVPQVTKNNALLIMAHLGTGVAEPARLAGHDLRGRDLSGQDLRDADLSEADLSEARLVGVDLSGANLHQAKLQRARMDRCNLTGARLTEADLTGARLVGADLSGADLSGARLTAAALIGARLEPAAREQAAAAYAALDGDAAAVQVRAPRSPVHAVAVAPDGSWIVSGGDDDTVRIWDAIGGVALRTMTGHTGPVWSVAVSPDGSWIVSGGGDATVRSWESTTGTARYTMTGHAGPVYAVAVSPDGSWIVSGGDDGTVRIWDAATGEPVRTLGDCTGTVWSVAVSPDGSWVVAGSGDGAVRVWDAAGGELRHTLTGHTGPVYAVAVGPDGSWLVSGSGEDDTVRVWDSATGAALRTLTGGTGTVWSVAVSPDGRSVISGGGDDRVRVWDVNSGALRHTLTGHTGTVWSVVVSPDAAYLVSGSFDATVRIWDACSGALLHTLTGRTGPVRSVAVSPDGAWLVSGADDATVRVWDAANAALAHALTGHTGPVYAVAVGPRGIVASGGDDDTVRVWEAATGGAVRTLAGHTGTVWSVAVSPDGSRVVSGSDDATVRVWDAASGALRHTLSGHTDPVYAVAVSPDGSWIVSGSGDDTVRVWDAASGELRHTLSGHTGTVWSVAVSPDGSRVVSGSDDATVRVWDAASGALRYTLTGHTDPVWSVAVSPGGGWLVSGSGDATVRVWEAATGAAVHTLSGHTGTVWSVAVSPDDGWLVSGSGDATVRVWDTDDVTVTTLIPLADGGSAALLPDLRYRLSGVPAGEFWYAINFCRFEPGELDPFLPALRRVGADDSTCD